MHELGVVFNIVDAAKQLAQQNQAKKITCVNIKLGEVSSVVPELLEDAWNWVVKKNDKIIQDCKLKIEPIKAITICSDCGHEYSTLEFKKICPKCKSENTFLKCGREFIIESIEVN